MTTSPRKDAFKAEILAILREREPGAVISRSELREAVKGRLPQQIDGEPCSPKCRNHSFKWEHVLDRCIYDLTTTFPPKIVSTPGRKGQYQLFRR